MKTYRKVHESVLRLFSSGAFFYVRLRTVRIDAQHASMNEFMCSEHSVRIRRPKKRSTGNQPLFRVLLKPTCRLFSM